MPGPKLIQIFAYDMTGIFVGLDAQGGMWCGHCKETAWSPANVGVHHDEMLSIVWHPMEMTFLTT